MADDIPIKISDNISASIERKIRGIGEASRAAASDVEFLKRQIASLSSSAAVFQRVSTAANTMRTAVRSSTQQLTAMSAQAGYLGARLGTVNQQARAAAQGMGTLSAAQNNLNAGFRQGTGDIGRYMGILAGAVGLRSLKNAADSYQVLINRIKSMGFEGAEVEKIYKRLKDVANENGVAVSSLGSIWQRVTLAQERLGASAKDVDKFLVAVASSVRIMGGESGAVSGAIVQLGQAISNTRVQMQEWNSIQEALPSLLQAAVPYLQKYGKSLAEITNFIRKGDMKEFLPSPEFFKAITMAAFDLERQAGELNLTITGTMTNLNNQFEEFIGKTGQTSGAVAAVNSVILLMADNIDKVVYAVLALSAAWGAVQLWRLGAELVLISGALYAFATVTIPTTVAALIAWGIAQGGVAAALTVTAVNLYRVIAPVIAFTTVVVAMTYAFAKFLDLITLGAFDYTGKVTQLFTDLIGLANGLMSGLVSSVIGVSSATASEMQYVSSVANQSIKEVSPSILELENNMTAVGVATKGTTTELNTMSQKGVASLNKTSGAAQTLKGNLDAATSAANRLGTALSAYLERRSKVDGFIDPKGLVGTRQNDLKGSQTGGGFNKGGSFMVGGRPGVDRNRVAMNVSRGEKVTVQTKRQQRRGAGSGGMMRTVTNDNRVINFNLTTPDVDSFRRSRKQVAADFTAIVGNG